MFHFNCANSFMTLLSTNPSVNQCYNVRCRLAIGIFRSVKSPARAIQKNFRGRLHKKVGSSNSTGTVVEAVVNSIVTITLTTDSSRLTAENVLLIYCNLKQEIL